MWEPKLNARLSLKCNSVEATLLCLALIGLLAGQTSRCDDQLPVRITIQPNDLVAIEGESAELNCDAEGEPQPTIEWYHNGQLIRASTNSRTTMGGSIQFLDIRPPLTDSALEPGSGDSGVYHCLARNALGEARSRNAILQVAYIKEDFRAAPMDKLVAQGETVTFDCLPQAWPEPRIRWRRNGRLLNEAELAQVRLADGSSKFSWQRIARTDLNIPADGNKGAYKAGPPEVDSNGSRAGGNQNDNAAAGQRQQLVDVFGSRFVIRQADRADEGAYSCLVETKGSHRLIERESRAGQLTTSVRPFFIEAPEHQSGQTGGQVRLRCRMGGDPEPVISWRRQNGQPLSEKITIDPNDKTLILDNLRVSDQGAYICEGENSVGSAQAVAQVSVNSRPRLTVQPIDQEVDIGGRAQLKCAGDANPPPMLFWYKEGHRQLMFPPAASSNQQSNFKAQRGWPQAAALVASNDFRSFGSPIQTGDTSPAINKLFTMPVGPEQFAQTAYSNNYFGNRIYVDNQGTLNIVNATSSDNGYYACALISSVGSVMAKAKLTVKQTNQLSASSDFFQDSLQTRTGGTITGKYDLSPPPVIKMGTANQTLPTNTSTTLLCEVVSQVAYKIQWYFDNKPLQDDPPRVTLLDTGALAIENLRRSDSGIYTCVVTAATMDNMPLASPFEPLDPSMLTVAPPVQQSTSRSCLLRVENPINPNIPFFRMEISRYPSPPGQAYLVSTNGNDAITIAWAPPADAGSLPVKQYVVEHYDTSQEHLGWRVIHKPQGKESLLIDGLSPEGSHFFVIRAANSHGTGPSSVIAGPMRTVAGEARYQAELQRRRNPLGSDLSDMRPDTSYARDQLMSITTNLLSLIPVSSNSIRLQWTTQAMSNYSEQTSSPVNIPLNSGGIGNFIEGFSIRYRAAGIGESLLSKDPLLGASNPSSLPLVTSYIDEEEVVTNSRSKRNVLGYYDYSQEFNEVRVADHSTEQYTINGLRPFTIYQFFVVPYFKDIDGLPSNILSAQTNEDRPSVAPPNLTIRPINNTAIRLLWIHVPPIYANGILRGYVVRVNRSDILNVPSGDQSSNLHSLSMAPKSLTLPLSSLVIAPLTAFNPESKIQPHLNGVQQFVVMYDIADLTFKSFYSIQVAAATSVGPGPWSESQNFVMDHKILASQIKSTSNEYDDVLSKSLLSNIPQTYENDSFSNGLSSIYFVSPMIMVILSILLVAGFLLYRRNNQKVITWKKTISEHFTNKFYTPSVVDHHHHGPNSIQQNIYDHQQHLIYSAGSTHMAQQSVPAQTMWTANNGGGCINSSGTGSLSSHGGLLPINNDPNATRSRINNEQILLMNNAKDAGSRFIRGTNPTGHIMNQMSTDSTRSSNHPNNHQQIVHHGGDYYSVINNATEYEELNQQQRNAMQQPFASNAERHQTGSSNSDTSCPSSVTRLLPNQNYNRDMLGRGYVDQQRHEMVLQQQIGCTVGEGKQPFMTMINGNEASKLHQKASLSPYATTNLMNQTPQHNQHLFSNSPMNLIDSSRQQNLMIHNGSTLDDSSRILMAQKMSGAQNPISSFRTLQRGPMSIQQRGGVAPVQNQMFVQHEGHNIHHQVGQPNYMASQFQGNNLVANITPNPIADVKSNLYEHIDYGRTPNEINMLQQANIQPAQKQQVDILSSSTSSGSVRSPPQHSPDQQSNNGGNKFRRGSSNPVNEAHDLRVFSSAHSARPSDCGSELQRLSGNAKSVNNEGVNGDVAVDEDKEQIDETTAFRQKSFPSDSNQRNRQLSKRKRQQQRNQMHNNNQKIG